MRYSEVNTPEDLSKYLDMYRGSGISGILTEQLSEDIKIDDAHAFSSLGDFLNCLIQYHSTAKIGHEITDDYAFNEIKELMSKMVKDPEYADYREFLEDKLVDFEKNTL